MYTSISANDQCDGAPWKILRDGVNIGSMFHMVLKNLNQEMDLTSWSLKNVIILRWLSLSFFSEQLGKKKKENDLLKAVEHHLSRDTMQ